MTSKNENDILIDIIYSREEVLKKEIKQEICFEIFIGFCILLGIFCIGMIGYSIGKGVA